ncbi:MAG: hypothetical protein H5T73_01435 [Actinobacteria bacterium]|nr:hypothetical protein [Actinomycetota bacterium]
MELAGNIAHELECLIREGRLNKSKQSYISRKPPQPMNDDGKLKCDGINYQEYCRESFAGEANRFVKEYIKQSAYKDSVRTLRGLFPDNDNVEQWLLWNFMHFLSEDVLKKGRLDKRYVAKLVGSCIKDLNKKPRKHHSISELLGVSILTVRKKFIIDGTTFILRQLTAKDLEKKVAAYEHLQFDDFMNPTMILEIKGDYYDTVGLEEDIQLAETVLRLFRVGSVQRIRDHKYTDSVAKYYPGKQIGPISLISVYEEYVLQESDFRILRKFWNECRKMRLWEKLSFSDKTSIHLSIAYSSYCDYLLRGNREEARIANLVMGMESLFLQENMELKYRLKSRVAKLFSMLGFNANEIQDEINDAYDIRSRYVHGELLDEKERRRFENRRGDIRLYMRSLANILRISILVAAFLNLQKKDLIDLIDASMIEKEKIKIIEGPLSKLHKTKLRGVLVQES